MDTYVQQLLKGITKAFFVISDSLGRDFIDSFFQLLLVPHISLNKMIEATDVLSIFIELEKKKMGKGHSVQHTERGNF